MIVYRVECDICPNHHGPTMAGRNEAFCNPTVAPDYGMILEPPSSDPELKTIHPWEVCGTLRVQFPRWWDVDWMTGKKYNDLVPGYRIAVYSVPVSDVRVGTNQVLFKRERAHVIRTFDYVPSPLK